MSGQENRGRYLAVLFLNFGVFGMELAAGLYSGSWAMTSDGLHALLHVMVALIALASTFRFLGNARAQKRIALLITALFFPLAGFIAWEGIVRLAAPPALRITPLFFGVALAGLAANIWASKILSRGEGGAYTESRMALFWHMCFDAAGSVIVIAGGVQMGIFGTYILDPILSLVLAAIIVVAAAGMLKNIISGKDHHH